MRILGRRFVCILFSVVLGACSAKADTIYTFAGDSFTFVQGVYSRGDRVTGSFALSDSFVADAGGAGIQTINSGIVNYCFTDGHQVLTQANSTGLFQFGFIQGMPVLPGTAGIDGNWYLDIQAPSGEILTESLYGDYQTYASLGGSQAEILSLNGNLYPGFEGTWTLQRASVPEKGSAAFFVCIGLASLTFVRLLANRVPGRA